MYRRIFIHWYPSNWPLKIFLEPLNHGNTLSNKIDQSMLYLYDEKSINNRASIFTTSITWEFLKEASVSQFKYLQTLQNKKFWHKGRAMANLNKKYLANSDQISVNFSESQLKPTISFSDLNREYDFLLDLNWLARKTPKKTT